jgi:hypothetical protein
MTTSSSEGSNTLRVLVIAIAGMFGGFLIPLLLIRAYRGITLMLGGTETDVSFPFTYAPETLAVFCAVALPIIDAILRARRSSRHAREDDTGGDLHDTIDDGSAR